MQLAALSGPGRRDVALVHSAGQAATAYCTREEVALLRFYWLMPFNCSLSRFLRFSHTSVTSWSPTWAEKKLLIRQLTVSSFLPFFSQNLYRFLPASFSYQFKEAPWCFFSLGKCRNCVFFWKKIFSWKRGSEIEVRLGNLRKHLIWLNSRVLIPEITQAVFWSENVFNAALVVLIISVTSHHELESKFDQLKVLRWKYIL